MKAEIFKLHAFLLFLKETSKKHRLDLSKI